MTTSRLSSSLALLAFLLCACVTTETPEESEAELRERLHSIGVEDGIDAAEADTIAAAYFRYTLRIGCGALSPVTDAGTVWSAPTAIGLAGLPGAPIQVDKRNGRVTCGDAPAVEDPRTIL